MQLFSFNLNNKAIGFLLCQIKKGIRLILNDYFDNDNYGQFWLKV